MLQTTGRPDRTVNVVRSPIDRADLYALLPELLLHENERRVSEQFVNRIDARRYITGRKLLRFLLASMANCSPECVIIREAALGKPFVVYEDCEGGLVTEFNVSHSSRSLLLAFSGAAAVGVDIETVRAIRDFDDVAGYILSDQEYRGLSKLPDDEKLQRFFATWVRKEAFVKAYGSSIAGSADRFRVPTSAEGGSWRVSYETPSDGKEEFATLHDIDVGEAERACLCVAGSGQQVRLFDFDPKVLSGV